MRKLLVALVVALAAAGAMISPPAVTPASAQAAVSISLFYRELAPHGRWFQHPRWGWAWFPTNVGADWRPYSRGQWVWTDENGWYWESEEAFGWAVYHYGRWSYDEEYGWIWIPGRVWGPAWVAFRDSDEYVGWAPLPPETLDSSYDWAPSYTELDASYYQPRWLFIQRRHFLSRRVYTFAAPVQRNVVIFRDTRNVTRYERGRRGVFNRSFEPRRLEAALGRRIAPVRINVVNDPRRVGPDRRGMRVNVFRPDVRVSRDAAPPAEARARAQDRPRVRIQREAVAPSERRERAAPPTAAPGARLPGEAPRTVQPDDRRDLRRGRDGREDRRVTTPTQPPGARTPDTATPRPGTPPSVATPTPRSAQPDERRGRDARGREERRAIPAPGPSVQPPNVAQPQTPRNAPPDLRRGREERRAAPTPPPGATPPGTPQPRFVEPPRAAPPGTPRGTVRPETPRLPPAANAPQRPPAMVQPAPRSAPPTVVRPPAGPPAQPPRVVPSAPPQRAAPAPAPAQKAAPAQKPQPAPGKSPPAQLDLRPR
jgi:hypothetical protein